MNQQEQRRKHLRELADTYHRGRMGDYDDTYEEFEATYLSDSEEAEEIPQYASVANDETYGMIDLCETLNEALVNQGNISSNGEYLNVPAGVYDLDTGKQIETRSIMLTKEQFELLPELFDDAIQYRRSDDEDEDGESDNEQTIKYAEIAKTLGI